jgi:hypothetical protein
LSEVRSEVSVLNLTGMSNMPPRFAAFAAAFVLHSATLNSVLASTRERPVVVEFFTSQGCSSCPPAEALLGEYSRRAGMLPLGFHVTYWGDLGWKDTFSLKVADRRRMNDHPGSGMPLENRSASILCSAVRRLWLGYNIWWRMS